MNTFVFHKMVVANVKQGNYNVVRNNTLLLNRNSGGTVLEDLFSCKNN